MGKSKRTDSSGEVLFRNYCGWVGCESRASSLASSRRKRERVHLLSPSLRDQC